MSKIIQPCCFFIIYFISINIFANNIIHSGEYTISIKKNDHIMIEKNGTLYSESYFRSNGYHYQQAVAFLQNFQLLVKNEKFQDISKLIDYSNFRYKGKVIPSFNPKNFLKHYSKIFTPELNKAIIQQNPNIVFANSQGIMLIEGGLIWANYCDFDKNKLCITSIN